MIKIMLGPCHDHFWEILGYIDISSKVAKFGSMDIVELHGDILQPWGGNLRPLVLLKGEEQATDFLQECSWNMCQRYYISFLGVF